MFSGAVFMVGGCRTAPVPTTPSRPRAPPRVRVEVRVSVRVEVRVTGLGSGRSGHRKLSLVRTCA